MFGSSKGLRVSPDRLLLATHGQARLQVEGRAYGFVRVATERRWVWGEFDETFVVALPERSGVIEVKSAGLLGGATQQVPYGPKIDLRSPSLVTQRPKLYARVRLPRSRSLAVRRIVAPRLEPLCRAPIQSGTSESESTS